MTSCSAAPATDPGRASGAPMPPPDPFSGAPMPPPDPFSGTPMPPPGPASGTPMPFGDHVPVTSRDALPTPGPAAPAAGRRVSRPLAFSGIAAIFVLFMAIAGAPSPLYVVYQREWGFSATTLTVIFAVYVFGLMASLLVIGALSDHVGRRPLLAAAIALEAIALVLFIVAGDVTVLLLARLVQGVATGAAMTTLAATLVDLNPPHSPGRAGIVNSVGPIGGLALGALGAGALVQYAPAPTHLVWALLLGCMIAAAAALAVIPETSVRRPGARASLTPRLRVPARLRPDVLALLPILIASWALGGLYLALGPSVAASLFGLTSHLIGGLVVTLLCGTGAAAAFALRGWPAGRILGTGASLLAAGTALTLAGVQAHGMALAGAGTVVAGIGFGAASLGTFGTLGRLAAPGERSELFAVAYVVAYLAFSVPAIAAGFASTRVGLHATTMVYGVVVGVLCLAALAAQRVRAARRPL